MDRRGLAGTGTPGALWAPKRGLAGSGSPGSAGSPRRKLTRPAGGGRRRWLSLTVQGWFRVVFAVVALLAVAAIVSIAQLLAVGRHVGNDLTGSILPAQAQAYRLQGALVDQETGVRGFGITRQPDFLQPYTAGLATEASAAARLHTMIGGNRQAAADLARLEQAADTWRRSFALPLIALARRGPLGSKDLTLLNQSKNSFDHLRVLFAVQNMHLAADEAHDSNRVRDVRDLENWTFVVVVVAFLLAAVALTMVLRRAVVRPLDRLRAASKRVVDGDFGHRIGVSGPSDLRAVAADVEAMRSELVALLDDARSSQEVAARQAADLDAKAAELLRSNAELEQFAYVASHDLQEPLRKVASFCQLLEKRYGDQLDDRGRQYIDFAVDGAKRLQILINDLLTFSRVGRGNQAQVPLALDGPLDAAIGAVEAAIEESGTVIERPAPLPEVVGDASLLAMLWQNLISNGIKFRAPGRSPVIRITVAELSDGQLSDGQPSGEQSSDVQPSDVQPSGERPSDVQPSDVQPSDVQPSGVQPSNVRPSGERPSGERSPEQLSDVEPAGQFAELAAGQSAGMWQFCVEDNGIGIAPEFTEKVFVIFQRLHGRDAYPGTGIGLALCKRIVEYHGGEIGVDTTYPGGTRICFTLPRIGAAEPEQAAADSGDTASSIESSEGIPA